MTSQRLAALLLTLAMLCWAGNILLGRAMHAAFTPTALSFWRWLAVLCLLVPVTAPGLWRKRAVLRRAWRLLLLQGLLAVTLFNWLLYQAVQTTTATNAALIYTNVPVFIVAVTWAGWGERIRLRQALGIAVSMAGVVAIITRGDPAALLGWDFTPGDLWALATVPVWGLYTITLRSRPAELSPLEFLAALVVIGMVFLTPAYLWERSLGVRVLWDWRTLGTIAYLALVASIVAFVLWNAGVPHLGANKAGLFTHLYPLFTAVLAVALLGEPLHGYHLGGAVLIFGGLYLTTATRGGPPASAQPPPGAARPGAAGGTGPGPSTS